MGAIFIDGLKLNLYLYLARKESETGLSDDDLRVKDLLEKDPYVREALGMKKEKEDPVEKGNEKIEMWAIVEIFGHQQTAGLVTEASIGGCAFVRVDVPEVDGSPAMTKFYGNGAIYSMTPTSEDLARLFVKKYRPAPLNIYMPEIVMKAPQLPGMDDPEEEECP